jgi:hypothetical protein
MSNVTNDTNSSTACSNGSTDSGLSRKLIVEKRGTSGAIAMNRSRVIANKLSEMTLDWLSCKSIQPDDALSLSRRVDLPINFDDGEEVGFEIDVGSSLRTCYELNRV